MKKLAIFCLAAFSLALIFTSVGFAQSTTDFSANGKRLFSRSWLWSPILTQMVDTSKFKKKPPYVIGFSNASVSNSWRVQFVNEFKAECDRHKDLIKAVYITDAQDKPVKQVADIEDLMTKNLDILVVAASESGPLDPIVSKIYKTGFPVAMIDRRITSENFVNFTTCSDIVGGRLSGLWLAEVLKEKRQTSCVCPVRRRCQPRRGQACRSEGNLLPVPRYQDSRRPVHQLVPRRRQAHHVGTDSVLWQEDRRRLGRQRTPG